MSINENAFENVVCQNGFQGGGGVKAQPVGMTMGMYCKLQQCFNSLVPGRWGSTHVAD